MEIQGFQKLTLLDYPGNLSCIIFTFGCDFRCPFCHNASLVTDKHEVFIEEKEIFEYLDNRKNIINSVCITGGEPLIQKDIISFIRKIKNRNLKVKLDTNGNNPDVLKILIDNNLVDFVALDIKNSKKKYGLTSGLPNINIDHVNESINMLLKNKVDYEFRTTVVLEFHEEEDFLEIAKWIKGCKKYVLQQFKDSGNLITEGLHGHSAKELSKYKEVLEEKLSNVEIRGL